MILEFQSAMIEDETGISSAIDRIAASSSKTPAVWVEAMGKSGQQLIKAAEKAAAQDLVLASTVAEGLRTFHIQIAQQVTPQSTWGETKITLTMLFEELTQLLQGLFLLGELSPRGRVVSASYGERASSTILAFALKGRGTRVQTVGGREVFLVGEERSPGLPGREETGVQLHREMSSLQSAGVIPILPASLRGLVYPQGRVS